MNGVTVKQATDQIMALCEKIKAHGIKCAFSSITLRGDELYGKLPELLITIFATNLMDRTLTI